MTGRRRTLWICGAVVVVFIVLRTYPFMGARTGRGVDSFDYRASARLPLFSRAFLAGARPFGYPLYLKLVLHNEHAAVVGQLVLGTIAWLALAFMVYRATTNPWLAATATFVVLAIGVSFEMIEWDRIISSESLSTACAVGLLAAVLWLRERWTLPRLALAAGLALAATALRDSNGTFLGLIGAVLLIAVVARRVPRRVVALAFIFIAVAIVGSAGASVGRRWEGPLKDVVTLRVLMSPERTAYFERAGMPLTPAEIAAARGHCVAPAPPTACVVIADPAFYQWIRDHGRVTYAKSLVKFPATTVWEPMAHLRDTVGTRVQVEIHFAADTGERAPLSKLLEAVIFIRNPLLLALWAVAVLALSAFALAKRRMGVWIVGATLVALVYPHLWLVWAGGALEVARHSLLASVQLRLGLWLTTLWLLDASLTQRAPIPATEAVDQDSN